MQRKRYFLLTVVAVLLSVVLAGCPSTSTQQKAALAAQNASVIVVAFQKAEISSYQAGLIPAPDHQFIEAQLVTVGQLGLALDSCIRTATNSAGTVACVGVMTASINEINTQGGLYLKSAGAKQDFQLAMTSLNAALAVLTTVLQ
jgi:hypothetical protein